MTLPSSYDPRKTGARLLNQSYLIVLTLGLALAFLAACAPQVQPTDVTVNVTADDANYPITLPAGSTVQQALDAAKITLASTDRVDPPPILP